MACIPFAKPSAGLFENSTQGIWTAASESKGGRSCSYSSGTLTVTAPNGSTFFTPAAGQQVRHKFFGTGNFLAVLMSETSGGSQPQQHFVHIVDFVAPSMTSVNVLSVLGNAGFPPWLQHSPGAGSLCLIGAPTASGVAGLSVFRSDNAKQICPGPGVFNATNQIIGEALASAVQVKHGGNIIAGPCPYPSGKLEVIPASKTFPTVKVQGCPQPPSTAQFQLKNSGDDCLTINSVASSGPYSVTAQSQSFPASLSPGQSMTVTVTFAPAATGTFNNVDLAISTTPVAGQTKLTCSGQSVVAQAAFTASPSTVNFGHVIVGGSSAGSFTVTNSGDAPIAFSVPASAPGSVFQWSGWSGTLGCGQNHQIAVTFKPIAEGAAQIVVTIDGTPGGSKTVTLVGDGCIPNAKIVAPPAPFPAFGDVRQAYRMPRFMTVQNNGDDTLTFTASISGPDAALFGLMKASKSITDVLPSRSYAVAPTFHCGGGATGDGKEEVVVVFHADAAPPHPATATLTIDNHNDSSAPASFTFALSANVIAGNTVDAVAVFDTSGSMKDAVPGGGTKMSAAIQAGRLLMQLIPPDLHNRAAGTLFNTTASTFLAIDEITGANQAGKSGAVGDPPLTPNGSTAIAAGAMVGLKEFATPHPGGTPANLTRAMIVLTDGMDNTAYKNPDDNKFYTVSGINAHDPGNIFNMVATIPFVPPADVKIYAVGIGTGQDVSKSELDKLSSASGGPYQVVDPTQPSLDYELMKYYTQIYMDMVDLSVIHDPKYLIYPGQKHPIEFDLLRGDVGGMVVIYDLHGLRLPFFLESPKGEILDAGHLPAGYQLRAGATESSRFLDFVVPAGEPDRYAGTWKAIIVHDGRVCRGMPGKGRYREVGFLPERCFETKEPVEYGIAIGAGSNFRLQAYVTPGPVKAGEPILLTGVPTEAGLAVTGCAVTVEAKSPNGQLWNFTLPDDGAHQDGDADDGEYARLFTHTGSPGSYTFTFRASGFTRDGEAVHREVVRGKYVDGWDREPPVTHDPGGGQDEECCRRLVRLLEEQNKLLAKLASPKKG